MHPEIEIYERLYSSGLGAVNSSILIPANFWPFCGDELSVGTIPKSFKGITRIVEAQKSVSTFPWYFCNLGCGKLLYEN